MNRVVLASASPRRHALLAASGVAFAVQPVDVDETPLPGEPPAELATRLARDKALACPDRAAFVVAADTVVALNGYVFGKPVTGVEAAEWLRLLRGQWHDVITAVAVRSPSGAVHAAQDRARVLMRDYTDDEIAAYIATGDPFDKAGAYAIQHPTFRPVARVEGAYDTVVGLPVALTRQLLVASGWVAADREASAKDDIDDDLVGGGAQPNDLEGGATA